MYAHLGGDKRSCLNIHSMICVGPKKREPTRTRVCVECRHQLSLALYPVHNSLSHLCAISYVDQSYAMRTRSCQNIIQAIEGYLIEQAKVWLMWRGTAGRLSFFRALLSLILFPIFHLLLHILVIIRLDNIDMSHARRYIYIFACFDTRLLWKKSPS